MINQNFSDNLYDSKFFVELTTIYVGIVKRIHKTWSEKRASGDKTEIESLYCINEKKVKKINDYFNSLITVISDIDKTIIFLKIKRETILDVYPELEYRKDYYKYHLENYIIRINSISDILGKLGNILHDTDIDDKKCNGYNFKDKLKKTDVELSKIMEELLLKISFIKIFRHQKLHTGDTKIPYLESVIFPEDIEGLTGKKTDPILIEYCENQFFEEIESIESEVITIIDIVNAFLDKSIKKLKAIAN